VSSMAVSLGCAIFYWPNNSKGSNFAEKLFHEKLRIILKQKSYDFYRIFVCGSKVINFIFKLFCKNSIVLKIILFLIN